MSWIFGAMEYVRFVPLADIAVPRHFNVMGWQMIAMQEIAARGKNIFPATFCESRLFFTFFSRSH
jgi:hypothetical protein